MDKKTLAKLTGVISVVATAAAALADAFPEYAPLFAAVAAVASWFVDRPRGAAK